jgi:mono/diheme cytochrome c family protein
MTSARTARLAAVAVGVAAAVFLTSLWPRASTPAFSEHQLAEAFDSGIRNLVIEWDAGDPRPVAERRKALFDFVYQTYGASAWIPQSSFDRNVIVQAVAGDIQTIVREKVGLVPWRDNPLVPAFGMAPNAGSDQPLRWTVNCLVCHTAEIDGVAYFGAGPKTFDDVWLGDALKRLTSARRVGSDPTGDSAVASEAHRILNSHHHDRIDSLTRGRSTAFAASHVELYLRTHDGIMPGVDEVGRADVKTPPLWHTAAKMPSERWYSDGSFRGRYPLMASSMELEKDRPFDALSATVVPIIKGEFDAVIRHLRPPRYPYPIDAALAARGRELFSSRELGCAQCHGDYDGRGNVEWPGDHRDVGTDRGRLDLVSNQFIAAFDASPLAAEGRLRKSRGYAATPLTGVWANYPYLHNGSVPTVADLLGPVAERPVMFQVLAARTLDRERLGQPLYLDPALGRLGAAELQRRFGADRDWFNTARPGASNAGHDVWSRIKTNANRRALIEYLKTL